MFCATMFAQNVPPQAISYRAIAKNGNTIVTNTTIGIKVSILDNLGGNILYAERHTKTTDANGAYNLEIGNGTALTNNFILINWLVGNKILQIDIDYSGGINYQYVGESQLLSVPFAFVAQDVVNGIQTVNNIEALRAYTNYTNNKILYVKGYYNEGDGGGGHFIYKTNETQPDNDGIFIKPNNNSGNGRWVRQYQGYLDIRYFGTEIGYPTGSVNNSLKIQKAIDYAHNNEYAGNEFETGRTIYFPNGTFYLQAPLILKKNIKIIGEHRTFLTPSPINLSSGFDYVFKMDEGIVPHLAIENISINLRNLYGVGAINIKAVGNSDNVGGLWNGNFKNIFILNLNGNGVYLEGGSLNSIGDYKRPNQFIIFENLRISRSDENFHSLKIIGQLGQTTFINCTFDGGNTNSDPNIEEFTKGSNVSIGQGAGVVSFINCTFQSSEYGVSLSNTDNIILDNCWFEALDIAINVYNSNNIDVRNCRFANAAGFGTRLVTNANPQGTGRCISVENSSINIQGNYTLVTSPDLFPERLLGEKFLIGVGNNNVINARNNYFQDPRLGETYGIHSAKSISSINANGTTVTGINVGGNKLVFVNRSGTIYRIDSTIMAGETVFIRANGGAITFYPTNPTTGTAGRNIYLNGRTSLTLSQGQAATFIKIDNIVGNEKATYQLVSISN